MIDPFARVVTAIDEFTLPYAPCGGNLFWFKTGLVEVCVFDRRLHLSGIKVDADYRMRGEGTRVMHRLMEIADKHGVDIGGNIQPFGTGAIMNVRQLRAWYRSLGFVVTADRQIFRAARQHADA